MKVTLSLETTTSNDVSIMVDALRASTTITLALNNFKKIIPCFSPQEAFNLKDEVNGVIAGERGGEMIEGFDVGNSPQKLESYKSNKDVLILTTSNGTRILENMNSTVLIGSMVNAKAVGKKSTQLATSHIDVVMAGVKGEFVLEDFLAAGEIIYWIYENLDKCEISEYAKSAILASRDYEAVKEGFITSRTGKRLAELGHKKDVEFCLLKNISDNVAIYENNEITLI